MAKVAFLLLTLALVQSVYTLKCYSCVSRPGTKFCNDITASKIEEKDCGMIVGNNNVACLKKVEYDTKMKMENVTRSCVVISNKDNACRSSVLNSEVKFCETCTSDLCNSASNLGFYSGVVGTIGFVVMKYFVL